MATRLGWQQTVLDHAQQQLGQLATEIVGLVGMKGPAGRMMQVQVDQRSLEGVLLALLLPVSANQFFQRQVVPGDQNDRIGCKRPCGPS